MSKRLSYRWTITARSPQRYGFVLITQEEITDRNDRLWLEMWVFEEHGIEDQAASTFSMDYGVSRVSER